jgi:DNA-binding transcriptional ArsR family regulator
VCIRLSSALVGLRGLNSGESTLFTVTLGFGSCIYLTNSIIFVGMDNVIETTLSALADHTRRCVVESLRNGPRRSGELASTCSVSAPVMSRHLRILRASGLVETLTADETDARLRVYRLRPEPFVSLKDWVDYMHAFWKTQLASFKSYAEHKRTLPHSRRKGARS